MLAIRNAVTRIFSITLNTVVHEKQIGFCFPQSLMLYIHFPSSIRDYSTKDIEDC